MSSGTYLWNPALADMVDEAFERARIDPAKITARHIVAARRSMNFMCVDWATQDYNEWRIQQETMTLTDGTAAYTSGTDFDTTNNATMDILDMILTRSSVDTPVVIYSRSEYLAIPDKTTEGRPDRVFVDKQVDNVVLTFWPVPENSTDTVTWNALRRFDDFDTASDDADVPYYARDAFCAGPAYRVCEKFGDPSLEEKLYAKSEVALQKAMKATRERGHVQFVPRSGRVRRTGRWR